MARPYITLSWGQTLDGRLATKTGDSQWIGGPESLQFAHELRRDNQAILVGIGTVLKDNPRLTCRIPGGRNPIRVVLDAQLRLPPGSALASTVEALTWVYTAANPDPDRRRVLEAQGVRVIPMGEKGPVDLEALTAHLDSQGLSSLFVEGGASVITSFLAASLADRIVVVTAPFLLGAGIEAVGDLGHRVLSSVPRPLRWRRWDLGQDLATELIFR